MFLNKTFFNKTQSSHNVPGHQPRDHDLNRDRHDDHHRDHGSTLMAVIGFMGVAAIITITVAAVTLNSLGFTSSTRAGVQAQAAAESGIDYFQADIAADGCSDTYAPGLAADFTAKVSYSLFDTGESWIAGCPGAAKAKRLKVVSTGVATATGVAGNSSGDTRVVESVFAYEPAVPSGIQPTGAAMYLYGGVIFKNNAEIGDEVGSDIDSETGVSAIQVKQGDVSCENNTVIKGTVVVENGNLNIWKCEIRGDAWASGQATLGTVTGNLTASNPTRPSGVGGSYTRGGTIPSIPDWVDFGYQPGEWIGEDGLPYQVKNVPAADCLTLSSSKIATWAGGKPIILNGLSCSAGVFVTGNVSLTSDTVIYAHKFDMDYRFTSSTAAIRRLWFITPDELPDKKPTCAPHQGAFVSKNHFESTPTVSAMLYTPCLYEAKNNLEWRGQIYVNGINESKNNTVFRYVGLGLPGVNLTTGTVTPGGSHGKPAQLGDQLTLRDLGR